MPCVNNDHKTGFKYYVDMVTKRLIEQIRPIIQEELDIITSMRSAKLNSTQQHIYCLVAEGKREIKEAKEREEIAEYMGYDIDEASSIMDD